MVVAVDGIIMSSAYISISQCVATKGMSLIKMMNNKGPSIDPCGTPVFMDSLIDNLPLNDVHCFFHKSMKKTTSLLHQSTCTI